jgi:tetratricopeptide (TPR) repeat protein
MARRLAQVLVAMGMAVFCAAWAAPAQAQNGTMTGRVVDSDRRTTSRDGKPLAGKQSLVDFQIGLSEAVVTLLFKGEPAKKYEIITDAFGEFYKSGLPPGTYDITVRREWRDPDASRVTNNKPIVFLASAPGIVLKPGEKLRVPDMGALTEEALASGRRPPTATATAAPGVSNAQIDAENKRNAELNVLLKDANSLFNSGKFEESVVKFLAVAEKLEGSDQSCARCYVKAGEAQVKLKNTTEAEKLFVKATEIDPNIADAYSQLASLYNGLGRLEDAAKMSAKATELTANSATGGDPTALYNQGVILWNAGKAVEARDSFAKAVKADPRNAKAQYYLGLTTFSAAAGGDGKMTDARVPLTEYLKLEPNGEFAETAKALLANIK